MNTRQRNASGQSKKLSFPAAGLLHRLQLKGHVRYVMTQDNNSLLLSHVSRFLSEGQGLVVSGNETGLGVYTPFGNEQQSLVKFVGDGICCEPGLKAMHVLSITHKNTNGTTPIRISCDTFKVAPIGYQSWWSVVAPEYVDKEHMNKAMEALKERIPDIAVVSFDEIRNFIKTNDDPRNSAAQRTINAMSEAKLNANKRLPWDRSTLAAWFNLDNMMLIYRSSASPDEPGAIWTNASSSERRRNSGGGNRNTGQGLPRGVDMSGGM